MLEKPQLSHPPRPELVQIIYRPELILSIQKKQQFLLVAKMAMSDTRDFVKQRYCPLPAAYLMFPSVKA